MTFQRRGTTSSVSVTSSPSFDSFVEPQDGQHAGAGNHHALARQMRRERFARRAFALKPWRAARLGRGFLGQKLIFGRGGLQFFELKLQLLQEARLALRTNAVKRAAQLLNLEPQMSDRRVRVRSRRIGPSLRGKPGGALGEDHRVSGGKIGGKSVKRRGHKTRESQFASVFKGKRQPTEVGLQVFCGLRQSIPDSR